VRPPQSGPPVSPPPRGGLKPTLRSLLYPAYPRSFKNCELLIEAMRVLPELELTLTFRGDETRYARKIRRLAEGMGNVRFAGFLSRAELEHEYARADALVFPSKLETWGLPLSEFRAYGKPIFAARLPYTREVLDGYARSAFFTSTEELVDLLKAWYRGEDVPYETPSMQIDEPFARNWDELTAILLRLVE
jgi:glycosyltransferase involved in cell wall biosynthesis